MSARQCIICGDGYRKRTRDSAKQWAERQYCSHGCRAIGTAEKRKIPLANRFWAKVVRRKEGCWPWVGATDQHGYGKIGRGSRGLGNIKAHRLSWQLHFGEIPKDLFVLHACDNPNCVNPGHLMVGTQNANAVDMGKKGRVNEISKMNLRSMQK